MFFTEMFRITEVKSAELPLVEEDNFEVELMTFRVKGIEISVFWRGLMSPSQWGWMVQDWVLKQSAAAFLPITRLFQKIVWSKLFTEACKVACITPIHKKAPTNWRVFACFQIQFTVWLLVFCGWLQIPFLLWFLVYSELHSYTNIQGWQNNQYHSHIESATTLSDNYDILYLLVEYCWIDIKTTNW